MKMIKMKKILMTSLIFGILTGYAESSKKYGIENMKIYQQSANSFILSIYLKPKDKDWLFLYLRDVNAEGDTIEKPLHRMYAPVKREGNHESSFDKKEFENLVGKTLIAKLYDDAKADTTGTYIPEKLIDKKAIKVPNFTNK